MIVILNYCWSAQRYGQFYGMLFGSPRRMLFARQPAAKQPLSLLGTNIALKKTLWSKASLNVLYSVVNYRSTLVILRVL